jgi:hypothetical protein
MFLCVYACTLCRNIWQEGMWRICIERERERERETFALLMRRADTCAHEYHTHMSHTHTHTHTHTHMRCTPRMHEHTHTHKERPPTHTYKCTCKHMRAHKLAQTYQHIHPNLQPHPATFRTNPAIPNPHSQASRCHRGSALYNWDQKYESPSYAEYNPSFIALHLCVRFAVSVLCVGRQHT